MVLKPILQFSQTTMILSGQQSTKHDLKKSKIFSQYKYQTQFHTPISHYMQMCDTSTFGIGASLLQFHNGTNKMNLMSAKFRLFTQAELRRSTLMRECTAIKYTSTNINF